MADRFEKLDWKFLFLIVMERQQQLNQVHGLVPQIAEKGSGRLCTSAFSRRLLRLWRGLLRRFAASLHCGPTFFGGLLCGLFCALLCALLRGLFPGGGFRCRWLRT